MSNRYKSGNYSGDFQMGILGDIGAIIVLILTAPTHLWWRIEEIIKGKRE